MVLQFTSGTLKDGPTENEPLMHAVLSSVPISTNPWIMACDRNMEPEECQQGERVQKKVQRYQTKQLRHYRTEAAVNVNVEKTLDFFVVCEELLRKYSRWE